MLNLSTFIHLPKLNFKKTQMKNTFKLLAIALLFASCQQQQKIGFIDNGDLIDGFKMKKDIEAIYKERNEAFQKRMDSVDRAFQVEVKAFQLAQSKMSQKNAQEKYTELGQRNQQLTQQFQKDRQVLQAGFTKEMDSVLKYVTNFIDGYGKDKGYTFILGKNDAGSVMYGVEANDITKEVTEALNADFKTKSEKKTEEKK